MVVLLGMLLRLVVVVFVLGALVAVARSLVRLAKAVLRGVVTVAAAVLCGIGAERVAAAWNWDYPDEIGAMVGMGAFVAILYFVRRSQRPDLGDTGATGDAALNEMADPRESDATLAKAWEKALQLAPRDQERVRVARAACARMAELVEAGTLDPGLIDCAAFARRTVPELVSTTQAVLVDADPAQRAQLLVGLVDDLAAIGRRAAAEVQRIGSPLRDKHAALRAHVATQAGHGTEFSSTVPGTHSRPAP